MFGVRWSLLLSLCSLASAGLAQQHPLRAPGPVTNRQASIPVPITDLLNSRGTSTKGENDGVALNDGSTFPSEFLPSGLWVDEGVPFIFPNDWKDLEFDNIRADGQVVRLPEAAELSAIHLVGMGEDAAGFLKAETGEELEISFTSGRSRTIDLQVKNWWCVHGRNKGPIRAPYHFTGDGSKNYNATHLFHFVLDLPPSCAGHRVNSLTLPKPADWNALHLFAISVTPAMPVPKHHAKEEDKVVVRFVRGTRRWEEVNGQRGQVVEVVLANPLSVSQHGKRDAWIRHPVDIALAGSDFQTIKVGRLERLMPGDDRLVEVLVRPTEEKGTFGAIDVVFNGMTTWKSHKHAAEGSALVHDWEKWTEDAQDLEEHTSPRWYSGAKFGIFIHWGLFAVPGFAPPKQYAEWYDYWLHDDPVDGPTYRHHLETYGADFVYDDFIPHFTGAKFDASEWVNLFAEAGARYFVLTTKHHDGYALFDTKGSSDRNSLKLGPKRDFLKELLEAAEKERPEIHRGTYFSMPEWYNPLYHKYGKVSFPGGLAHNPYKPDEEEPYTGFVEVDDYIEDIQLAQMRILAQDYKTEIMWCDIGLANHSSAFAAEWYASTAKEGRQVAIDDRCGIAGDFDSPEMTQFSTVQRRKWETCAGMDPYSFGYNKATKPEEYRSADSIIHNLIDITAKGGNYLLNIGPDSEGVIVDGMVQPLLEAGRWLKSHGRAIYDTDIFPLLPELIDDSRKLDLRFTRTQEAFYILSLRKPLATMEIKAPLPILEGDRILLLGEGEIDEELHWRWEGETLKIEVGSEGVEEAGRGIAWVLEVVPGLVTSYV